MIKVLRELSNHMTQSSKDMTSLSGMKNTLIRELSSIQGTLHNIDGKANETSSKLDNISSTLLECADTGNRLATEHRILKSLRFRSMEMRHAQITEAHKRTFEWAYTSRITSNNTRTQFQFAEWLRSGNSIYWIAGKAGSGKSTLVKFLYDSPRTMSELKQWAGNNDIVTAGFFCWNAGTEMQKSVEGLLQSLLFEILQKCPILIPVAAPKRWAERCSFDSDSAIWTPRELKDGFKLIQEQLTLPAKFCLFIDGLDEFEGNHSDVVEILQGFATTNNVKICLSSRPWNIFQEKFGQRHDRRLILEELTKPDIELYVRETFESNSHFLSLKEMDTRYMALVDEIVQKSDGVFLWVFLIVRSLLDGLLNCDRISELQTRMRSLPSRLEDYFLQILTTTDEIYAERAAETFHIALQTSRSLSLMTYSYFDEEDPDFVFNIGIKPLTCREVLYRLRTMKRRLNARCNGLLEITNFHTDPIKREAFRRTIDEFWSSAALPAGVEVSELLEVYRVEFLHRTVRDFLRTKDMHSMIQSKIANGFQFSSVLFRATLAQLKALPIRDKMYCKQFKELVDDLVHYAHISDVNFQKPELETLDELERTLCALDPLWQIEGVLESLDKATRALQKSFFEYVVQNGLCGYISRKIAMGRRLLPNKQILLASALKLSSPSIYGQTYYPSMVKIILDFSNNDVRWSKVELPSLWTDFLNSVPILWNKISQDAKLSQLQIVQILLDFGANPNQSHCGEIVWEKVLDKVQSIVEGNDRELRIKEMEILGRYRALFKP